MLFSVFILYLNVNSDYFSKKLLKMNLVAISVLFLVGCWKLPFCSLRIITKISQKCSASVISKEFINKIVQILECGNTWNVLLKIAKTPVIFVEMFSLVNRGFQADNLTIIRKTHRVIVPVHLCNPRQRDSCKSLHPFYPKYDTSPG